MDAFVKVNDACKVLLEYIGSEEYERAVETVGDHSASAFMGGIGMAGVLILARCQKYYGTTDILDALGNADKMEKEREG